MRRATVVFFACIVLLFAVAHPASACYSLEVRAVLLSDFSSIGDVFVSDCDGMPAQAWIYGRHWVFDVNAPGMTLNDTGPAPADPNDFYIYGLRCQRCANWHNVFSATSGTPGKCYRASVRGSSHSGAVMLDQTTSSAQVCVAGPPPPPPKSTTCEIPSCPPNGEFCDRSGDPYYECAESPIVLDFGGNGYRLTGLADPVAFDLDADGDLDVHGWTRAGSEMAFLAVDLNRNGVIDNGRELFGDATLTPSGKASNGFQALSQYDDNSDGVVDHTDAAWSFLLLWTDRNHNGRSEPEELSSVAASDIASLGLDYRWTGRRDASGNLFRYAGTVTFGAQRRQYYDIFFVVQR